MASPKVLTTVFVVLLHLGFIPSIVAMPDLPHLSAFWPDLSRYIGPPPSGNANGKQNFTYCCARALDTFIANGHQNSSDISVASAFSTRKQFPCGASYQGDRLGAPTVMVSYNWCSENCSGWQRSESAKLTQWLQPFIGFILPAIVFALNVPRRRKLQLPDWVFPRDIADPLRFLYAMVCAFVAAFIVALDTIIWLLVVFALAGPLLLSGLYEAWLDKRIVDFAFEKIRNNRLPLPLRVKILVAVLVGNLDQDTAWKPAMSVAAPLDQGAALPEEPRARTQELYRRGMPDVQKRLRAMIACQYSFGSTIGAPIVFYIGSFVYAIIETKSQLGDNDTSHALAFGMWWMSIPHIAIVSGCLLAGNDPNTLEAIVPHLEATSRSERDNWLRRHTVFLRRRADSMFGSTYDAKHNPAWMWDRGRSKRSWLLRVCREYAVEDSDNLKKLTKQLEMGPGDWTIVSSLAFVMFFIPCMFGFLTSYYTPQIDLACRSITFLVYACSQAWLLLLWIWNFTWRDKDWRQRPRYNDVATSTVQHAVLTGVPIVSGTVVSEANEAEKDAITTAEPSTVPNPQTVPTDNRSPAPPYSDSQQTPVIVATSSAAANPTRTGSKLSLLAKARWFTSREEMAKSPIVPSPLHIERIGFLLFWILMGLGFVGAIFSAIGGTMMQIVGVYRTCLCYITEQTWLHGRGEANLIISTNNALDLNQASHFWIPMGAAATGFLGAVTYIAWWYQRRLRTLFGELVDLVGTDLPEQSIVDQSHNAEGGTGASN